MAATAEKVPVDEYKVVLTLDADVADKLAVVCGHGRIHLRGEMPFDETFYSHAEQQSAMSQVYNAIVLATDRRF